MRRLIALFRPRPLSRPVRRVRITAWGVEHDVPERIDERRLLAGALEGPR